MPIESKQYAFQPRNPTTKDMSHINRNKSPTSQKCVQGDSMSSTIHRGKIGNKMNELQYGKP